MNEQLLKTSGANVLSSRKKLRKTLWGVTFTASPPPPYPPTLYVQGLKNRKILKTEHEEGKNCMQGTTR